VNLSVALVCFPIIFIGELPDKTMFASLLMATRGRPRAVWAGAAAAFLVHVVIATTIGVGAFAILPHRVLDGVIAGLFLVGAGYAFWASRAAEEEELIQEEASRHGVVATAFLVIFVAEWGDLTQILTANLAARYHAPFSVGVSAVLALWSVAAIAVVSGSALLRFVSVRTIRLVTAVVLVGLAGYTAWTAAR
jgi:putative Ca2+/H+ antiporter (TMEM165/GDT1 family)